MRRLLPLLLLAPLAACGPGSGGDAGAPDAGPAADAGSPCGQAGSEMQACVRDGAAGFCRAGGCATDVRRTRALGVVVDFSDRVLEDYAGAGFASEQDLREALDEMERHWWWASQGRHRATWDVVRVRLAEAYSEGAFGDWVEFRDAAARAVRDRVDAADYDADGDGVVDAAFLVVALGTAEPEWALGGMSRQERVNLFVDGQNSQSVRSRAIGNFNHEFGHCLGLPDLYGDYGTIHWLSFMADSWPVPSMGLSAYDKWKLGWLARVEEPEPGRRAVLELPPAESALAAVRIAGPRSESFLVEHRRRPGSGFGSLAPAHGGLAVYHVLEGSSQGTNPPLLKLEPADGALAAGQAPQAADLFEPGDGPYVAKSWLTGAEVFRLENVQADGDSLVFEVLVSPSAGAPPANLLRNGSFEEGTESLPDGWSASSWQSVAGTFGREAVACRDGAFAARLRNSRANDASLQQTVTGLRTDRAYLLCGWLRGEDVADAQGGGIGANVSVAGTWTQASAPFGTFDWTQRCVAFTPEASSATVAFRLGFYGSTVTGRAWGDDFTLEPLAPAFP